MSGAELDASRLETVRRATAVTGAELEAFLERARDPALIPGIYNYCLRRCDRCAFAGRCFLYRENAEDAGDEARRCGDGDQPDVAALRATVDLIRAWCEREGAEDAADGGDTDDARDAKDTEDAADAEGTETSRTELEHRGHSDRDVDPRCGKSAADAAAIGDCVNAALAAAERDPLYLAAMSYEEAAYRVIDPLRALAPFHEWPPNVAEALDTIGWNAGALRAKLYRALCGRLESSAETDVDPVQNDWNGSAKVARLAVAGSVAAWELLFVAGETPYDAPIRQRRRELEQIDEAIARRFPRAMEFVRPGFDEPDVAGAPRSPEPSDPPRQSVLERLRRWFAGRLRR